MKDIIIIHSAQAALRMAAAAAVAATEVRRDVPVVEIVAIDVKKDVDLRPFVDVELSTRRPRGPRDWQQRGRGFRGPPR